MKTIVTLSAALVAGSVLAMPAGFTTDYDGALKRAAERNVPTLVLFTGSDWCGWCIKLENEVFSKPEFTSVATNNFELVFCDFPSKTKLPEDLAKRNDELQKKYGVRGYPTIVALDPKGEVLTTLSYQQGGAEKWLAYATKELAMAPLVLKYFKPFESEFGDLRKSAVSAMKAMFKEQDPAKRDELLKTVAAEALVKGKALRDKLAAAKLPAELASRKDAMLKVVERIITDLEKGPQPKK